MSEDDLKNLMDCSIPRSDELIRHEFGKYLVGHASLEIIKVSIKFGIFDITTKPTNAETISRMLETNYDLTKMLLDSLVHLNLLNKKEDEYVNTEISSLYLNSNSNLFQKYNIENIFDISNLWKNLELYLKDGPKQIQRNEIFGEKWISAIAESCMAGVVGSVVEKIGSYVDLSKYNSLLDLGGGHGLYAIGFIYKYPNFKGYLFDLPTMCDIAKSNAKKYDISLTTICGDFYKDDLGHYDVVFSSFNFSTSDVKLAKKVYMSVNPGGLLILRRHLPTTSLNPIKNLEWSLHTWDGKGNKNYGGSWLPSSEQYIEKLLELGMSLKIREKYDENSEIIILEK